MAGLHGILARAAEERACRLATVVGDAGVGKTRLVSEFTNASATTARVIRGRCLPYGDGITFWPLRELVRDACGIMADDAGDAVEAKLHAGIPDREVADRLASVIGVSPTVFPVPELFWGARRFLEHLGGQQPVLAIIDDIHWAESTFLDLIDSLVESVADAPVLLLCTSRHELIERQPDWGVSDQAIRLVLQPLSDADAGRVVESLLGGTGLDDSMKSRILQSAAGNPLFVEQLLSMLIDDGTLRREGDHWVHAGGTADLSVPPTIQALLAARLDLLETDEREVIEPASVVGQNFAVPALEDLVAPPLAPQVPVHLATLSGKQLVQPNPGSDAEGAYRFQHLLVRDAAYNGLLKRERADLHQRFVSWAEAYNAEHGVDNREFEEIHGYHLEQAHRYLSELGTVDPAVLQLGRRASDKLASAGRRAMTRGDTHAAASLLQRATGVLPKDDLPRGALLPRLAEAYLELGSFDDASARLDEAVAIARIHEDQRLEADATLVSLLMKVLTSEMADWGEVAQTEVARAIPIFEAADDAASLALAYRILVYLHGTPGRYGEAAAAARQVITYARAADERRLETRGMIGYIQAALLGPTPVVEAIAECQDLVREADGDRRAEGLIKLTLAQLYAMRGEFQTARDLYREARAMLAEIKAGVVSISTSVDAAQVEFLAGDPQAAAALLREDAAALEAVGEQYIRSTVLGLLARAHVELGQLDQACELADSTSELAADDDVDVQVALRSVKARCLVADGDATAAVGMARQTLELSTSADNPRLHAFAESELAETLSAAGAGDEARAAWDRALSLYDAKGDEVSSQRIGSRIAEARRSHKRRRASIASEASA
jgi:tetratricopeptide (TPR) repeat protein